jgi:peptide/nickel transport system substrate-binding protein
VKKRDHLVRRVVLLMLAGSLVAGACGDDDDDSAADSTSTVAGSTSSIAGATSTIAGSTSTIAGATGTSAGSTSAATSSGEATSEDFDADASLIVGYLGPNLSLDPRRQQISTDSVFQNPIYDRLTRIENGTYLVKPMLATSWEATDDGSALVMELRDDVTFHDGTPFDATAVKANIESAKTVEGSTVATALASISSVEVVDAHTVRFNLEPGLGADLPAVLATNAGAMISPAALADPARDLILNPGDAGSGPYIIREFKPNDRAVYDRAPGQHWDQDAGRLAGLEIRFIPQPSANLTAVQAGDIDVGQLSGPDAARALELADSGDLHAARVPVIGAFVLNLQPDRPAFADIKVRQAINYAIDKETIGEDLLGGLCRTASQFYESGHWAYSPEVATRYSYDPDRATALLEEAGATGTSFDLVFSPGSIFEQVANVVADQLGRAGLDVNLVPMATSEATAAWYKGELDAYLGGTAVNAEPSVMVNLYFLESFKLVSDSSLPQVQELARQGLDPRLSQDERAEVYQELFAAAAEDGSFVPICHNTQAWAYQEGVSGVEEVPGNFSGLVDLRYLAVAE